MSQTAITKKMTYSQGNCIMVLVGQQMGVAAATMVDDACRCLDGKALHPMSGVAIERAAVAVNDALRHDPKLIEEANTRVQAVLAQFGLH